jgi:glutamyl-tRNA synthetase
MYHERYAGSSGYRGRFAPSPTGALHLGSARTALIAWLRARASEGSFVIRTEDLDAPRVVPGADEAIRRDLRWLGLDWDEGPDVGGPCAPYAQSARLGDYAAALAALRTGGHVYPCTCTRKEIAAIASAPHGLDEEGPRYPGTCRDGPRHPERPASWRFRMPEPSPGFTDALAGTFAAGALGEGDFVVARGDGAFSYQLAVVVDDLAMRISEVVRGDDLLSSVPRQLALARALGGTAPAWLHVPLVLATDGQRLGKRHGSASVASLRERGESAASVVGKLGVTLGLAEPGEQLMPAALIARFDLAKLPRAPTRLADD